MSAHELFILNNEIITDEMLSSDEITYSSLLLDFVRYNKRLPGTKIGCREGDCGACTVLVGDLVNDQLGYQQIVSCLTPIGNIIGKHVVTIEGINREQLTPIQREIINEGGTQCGACTPGFVVSLTGYALNNDVVGPEQIIGSMDGNICRCTGYKSLEKAAISILPMLDSINNTDTLRIQGLVENKFIPDYFLEIKDRLINLNRNLSTKTELHKSSNILIGGGTDLYVQRSEWLTRQSADFLELKESLSFISHENGKVVIGAGITSTQLMESKVLTDIFPNIYKHFKLFGSTLIRNIATLGGNIVNGSPIADMVIFFLALNPTINLQAEQEKRSLNLRDFYLDYKTLDLKEDEIVSSIDFSSPPDDGYFNFEKVSKRTYLDIASVNSGFYVDFDATNTITTAGLTAGGVAPVPKYLTIGSEYLIGKQINNRTLLNLLDIVDQEISPISDVRGSAEYKRLLLRQLIIAHFITLFENSVHIEELIA